MFFSGKKYQEVVGYFSHQKGLLGTKNLNYYSLVAIDPFISSSSNSIIFPSSSRGKIRKGAGNKALFYPIAQSE
nr:hypothetical protein Q903MT_gene4887 [Picea sitchensis]